MYDWKKQFAEQIYKQFCSDEKIWHGTDYSKSN